MHKEWNEYKRLELLNFRYSKKVTQDDIIYYGKKVMHKPRKDLIREINQKLPKVQQYNQMSPPQRTKSLEADPKDWFRF
jgi:hypothetical protein